MDERRIFSKSGSTPGYRRQRLILDLNEHGGVFRLITRVSHYKRDHFADMANLFTG